MSSRVSGLRHQESLRHWLSGAAWTVSSMLLPGVGGVEGEFGAAGVVGGRHQDRAAQLMGFKEFARMDRVAPGVLAERLFEDRRVRHAALDRQVAHDVGVARAGVFGGTGEDQEPSVFAPIQVHAFLEARHLFVATDDDDRIA